VSVDGSCSDRYGIDGRRGSVNIATCVEAVKL
jgi:hypothetical protein